MRLILHILLLPLVNRYVLSLQLIVDQGLKFNPLRVLFILIFVELGFDFFEKLFTDFALKLWLVEIDQDLPINFKEAREIELEVVFCEDFDEFSVLLTLALKEGLQFEKATLKGIIFFKLGWTRTGSFVFQWEFFCDTFHDAPNHFRLFSLSVQLVLKLLSWDLLIVGYDLFLLDWFEEDIGDFGRLFIRVRKVFFYQRFYPSVTF